jgi:hypothetical protein
MAIIILSFMVNVFILLYGHHYIHMYVICFYSKTKTKTKKNKKTDHMI